MLNSTRQRSFWLICLLAIALIVALIQPLKSLEANFTTAELLPKQTKEIRGVWLTNIDSEVLFSQENTIKALDKLTQLNFNTVYPTVWNWGYTLYPSQVARKEVGLFFDPEPKLQGRDILKEIVTEGHKRGLTVIPWFEFGFMAPADSTLAKRHPHWLTKRYDGSTIWLEGKVHQRVWLNPLRPDVQKFITDLLVEVVSRYDIDGIQLDDHFGYPSDFGYDDFTVKLYKKEHNGKAPPQNAQDPKWIAWRAAKITDYMTKVFKAIKKANPLAIISVSPNPQQFSRDFYLLDWEKWERKGLIEELILQVYRSKMEDFHREIEQAEVIAANKHIPTAIGILAGLKGRPVSLEMLSNQVQSTRDRHYGGVSFFFYESLWNWADETPETREKGLASLFPIKVKRPSL
jgi:uncharacterized lipoprotein YddW (UPF0748 family)